MRNLVPIDDIIMKDRAREDYGDLDALQASMAKYGQLHPIVITEDKHLVAGGRRYSAAILLGWDDIEVKYFEGLTPLERKEIELEENLIRKDLEWQETVNLRKSINELKGEIAKEKGESWKVEDTAKVLDVSRQALQEDLDLAKSMEEFPDVVKCKTKKEAKTKARRLKRAQSRAIQNEIFHAQVQTKDEMLGIKHGDCLEILKSIPSHSVDLIISDPPFGIDFDQKERNDQFITTYGEVEDTTNIVRDIVEPSIEECARILKPGCHMYLFFGVQHAFQVYMALEATFILKTQKTPLFWLKGSGENYKPYHRFTVNYESFYFSWKAKEDENPNIKYEQKEFNKTHTCTFPYQGKTGKKEHPAQKPIALYRDLLELSSQENDIVLDPFLGSGISLVAAKQMGRRVIGIEQHEDWYNLALHNLNNAEEYDE
jgi:DNA modification methylase